MAKCQMRIEIFLSNSKIRSLHCWKVCPFPETYSKMHIYQFPMAPQKVLMSSKNLKEKNAYHKLRLEHLQVSRNVHWIPHNRKAWITVFLTWKLCILWDVACSCYDSILEQMYFVPWCNIHCHLKITRRCFRRMSPFNQRSQSWGRSTTGFQGNFFFLKKIRAIIQSVSCS